jgi:hypothetical protein
MRSPAASQRTVWRHLNHADRCDPTGAARLHSRWSAFRGATGRACAMPRSRSRGRTGWEDRNRLWLLRRRGQRSATSGSRGRDQRGLRRRCPCRAENAGGRGKGIGTASRGTAKLAVGRARRFPAARDRSSRGRDDPGGRGSMRRWRGLSGGSALRRRRSLCVHPIASGEGPEHVFPVTIPACGPVRFAFGRSGRCWMMGARDER